MQITPKGLASTLGLLRELQTDFLAAWKTPPDGRPELMNAKRLIVLRLVVEMTLLLLPSSAFLYVYVILQGASYEVIPYHLLIVSLAALMILNLRVVGTYTLGSSIIFRHIISLLVSTSLLFLIVYYSVVIIGLTSWDRVASWRLLETYIIQLPKLLESMEIRFSLVIGAALTIYASIFIAVYTYLKHFEWVDQAIPLMSRRMYAIILIGILMTTGLTAHQVAGGYWTHTGEPFSLSSFPKKWRIQDHDFDETHIARLTKEEELARNLYTTEKLESPANIVLIVADALRPDHMGIMGYERETTPYLSSLTKDYKIIKSDRMYATCSASSCGLLSMASSRYIEQFTRQPITLQEVLRIHGYNAHMILGGDHTNFYGLRELYGDVDSYHDGTYDRTFYVNDDRLIIDRLNAFPAWDGKPSFFQFHLMSTHSLGLRFLEPSHLPQINYSRPEQQFGDHPEERREAIVNFYDNGILQADHIIQQIMEALLAKGYLEKALIVITADHGEALGEHGLIAHSNSIREPVIRIPFILFPIGFELPLEGLFDLFASQIDIAPTILDVIDAKPPSTWRGNSLIQPHQRDYIFFRQRSEIGLLDLRASDAAWKFWRDSRTGEEYAFNLLEDPGELHNQADKLAINLINHWRNILLEGHSLVTDQSSAPN